MREEPHRRSWRKPAIGGLGVALAFLAFAGGAFALPSALPQRFEASGLDPTLGAGPPARVRVLISLRDRPVERAAQVPARRRALSGRLSASELAALRRGSSAGPRIAGRHQRARDRALEQLHGAARAAERSQAGVLAAVRRAGGQVVERDPQANTVTAELPGSALHQLVRRRDVTGTEAAPERRPLGLETSTAAVGAPSFWGAGHSGGRGAADVPSADAKGSTDLAIIADKIQEDHPAFAGIAFQRPQGTPQNLWDDCPAIRNEGCDHGTEVASMAISHGASGCSRCVPADASKKGVAPGLHTVLDAHSRRRMSDGTYSSVDDGAWALGVGQTIPYPYDVFVPGATDAAEVMNYSSGSYDGPTVDDSASLQGTDKLVSSYGTALSSSGGNDGPAQSMSSPCIAYNTLCAGAMDMAETANSGDDTIPAFSSRGPTPAGRKKPDLVAVGDSELANRRWWSSDPYYGGLWTFEQGTSYSAPQVGAAASLLAGSGISDPLAQKAILLDSARQGRASPSAPMGTQSGWQPDWGWGALDLGAALRERTNFHTQGVPGNGVRFYRSSAQAAGDRATLVWNRRASGCLVAGCGSTASTLTNLDLFELDPASGAERRRSASAIDNVEQVRAPAPGPVLYKVKAASSVDGLAAEPFALAATRQVTPLVTPQPTAQLAASRGEVRPGQEVAVKVGVRNPSPDLSAEGAQATLELPAGVELAPGSGPQTQLLGTLAPSGAASARWSVRGTSDGLRQLTGRVSAQRYGESFSAADSKPLLVDGTPPKPSLSAPAGTTPQRQLVLSWGATDASPVVRYDLEVSADGGAFTPLLSSSETSTTYHGASGHRYRFRVRAEDRLGNLSPFVTSGEVALVDPRAALASPSLRLRKARFRGRTLLASGTVARAATGSVAVTYSARRGVRRLSLTRIARVARGRFSVRLRLSPALRAARRGKLIARYAGDARHAAAVVRRTVRR